MVADCFTFMDEGTKENNECMKILYLTYDGLSDPLGQSQILPYLKGLSGKGYELTVVSFEKKNNLNILFSSIKQELDQCRIAWIRLNYTKHPPLVSTLYDLYKLNKTCNRLQKKNHFSVVHCRSYITSLAGQRMKNKFGVKFIFDMRGFFPDERVEGGLWDQNKFIYRRVYLFFKKKEKEFLAAADKIVVLTNAAKELIARIFPVDHSKMTVIPCCADTNQFDPTKIDHSIQTSMKQKLSIHENDFVISYLGAIGTWYLLDEMLDFFRQLLLTYSNAKFLFITHHPSAEIYSSAQMKNIPVEKILVVKAQRNEVPMLLSLSHLAIYFIMPTFSKIASSPTKQAELFSMGIPVICNAPVGDAEEIIKQSGSGLIISKFTNENYDSAITNIPQLMKKDKKDTRDFAIRMLSLEIGIARYQAVYEELTNT